jgi:hypothetical protein
MEYTGYIVLKFYEKDIEKVDSPKRLYETIFLKPEYDINTDKENKPDVLPIYTSLKDAEADADWWSGHTNEDYGIVKKVTITIEDKDTFNTIESERKTLNNLISKYPEDNQAYKDTLKEISWYNKD